MGEIIDFSEAPKKFSVEELENIVEYAVNSTVFSNSSEDETFSDICRCYEEILSSLGVDTYKKVSFVDYEDVHLINVDENIYDADDSSLGEDLKGAFCEIDALIADMAIDFNCSQEKVLKNVEKRLSKDKEQ